MATITKKEMIDRVAVRTNQRQVKVKEIVQAFLDQIISELGKGNRVEFRDFGIFQVKTRKARRAQNPRNMEPVNVPEKRAPSFKAGRLMKQGVRKMSGAPIGDQTGDVAEMSDGQEEE